MGATYPIGDFTVEKSNPGSGTIVRFTITDSATQLTTTKLIRAVLGDAIDTWIADERSDLDTNGDTDVLGSSTTLPGDGFAKFDFVFASKYAQVTLTSKSNISVSGNITASIPYADVS